MNRCSACGIESAAVTHGETASGQRYGMRCSPECDALLWAAMLAMSAPAPDPAQARHESAAAMWALRQRRAEVRGLPFVEPEPMSPVALEAIRIRRSFGLEIPK